MTAQAPHRLINEYPGLDLGQLELYAVIDGEITTEYGWGDPYVFSVKPKDMGFVSPDLPLGYVATFRLTKDGELELIKYDYPYSPEYAPDEVHEMASGDFLLVMKEHFYGSRTYIPFRDGRVVSDHWQWIYEQEPYKLINDHPSLNLNGLELYGVIRGNLTNNHGGGDPYEFSFRAKPLQDEDQKSCEPVFRLTANCEFELAEYVYPRWSQYQTDEVHELARGDFWLVMREHFSEPRIYVPFRDSRVVEDRQEWAYEQVPDKLINEHPKLNLDGLSLVAVMVGDVPGTSDWGTPYRFLARPMEMGFSSILRPYGVTLRLTANGELELVEYRYPASSTYQPDVVHEMLDGDFWLVMKKHLFGPRAYIPFQDGKIVFDLSRIAFPKVPHGVTSEYPGFML